MITVKVIRGPKLREESKLLKAISDETRLLIIGTLLEGEKCACEIIPYVNRTASTVSIQLGILENANIISSRREGKKTFYKITNKKVCNVFRALHIYEEKNFRKCCT